MFTERKIEAFQQPVAGLPDTPNLSAAALKARFDACPEELRAALNGVCDDGAALEARIDAYRAQTFEGEITKSMLAPAVRTELESKADAAANTAAHSAFSAQIAEKCEISLGSFTGDGADSQLIELGFQPKAVIVLKSGTAMYTDYDTSGGLAFADAPAKRGTRLCIAVEETGFRVYYNRDAYIHCNYPDYVYSYLVFR